MKNQGGDHRGGRLARDLDDLIGRPWQAQDHHQPGWLMPNAVNIRCVMSRLLKRSR